jgi:RNA polymerase sigma factor (sigma-70 family)
MPALPIPLADFELLCEVIRGVARSSGLSTEDAEDFAQTAHLKLLECSYAPLTRFKRHSSLRTFLTVVVRRLLLDWRNAAYGRWRPTMAARRLGPDAITLDRLISRDGHSRDEAIAILENRRDAPCPTTLHALAKQLAPRGRPEAVAVDDERLLGRCGFEDPIEAAHASAEHRKMVARLTRAFERLSPADRQLVRLRFGENMSIAAIAVKLAVPVKPLYRRFERLLMTLRQDIAGMPSARRPRVWTSGNGRKKAAVPSRAERVH